MLAAAFKEPKPVGKGMGGYVMENVSFLSHFRTAEHTPLTLVFDTHTQSRTLIPFVVSHLAG